MNSIGIAMGYDIGWIIPKLRSPGRLWTCASSVTVAVVGLFSKFIICKSLFPLDPMHGVLPDLTDTYTKVYET